MRLELHINTDTAAFGDEDADEFLAQQELGRILAEVGHAIKLDGYELGARVTIHDADNSVCGFWVFTDEEPSDSLKRACGDAGVG